MSLRARPRGFTLVSAIFLMVVLVVLSVSLVTMSSVAHTTSAQQIQSVRGNYAARAGVEWAVNQAGVAGAGACPATTFTPGGALSSFTVTVTCSSSTHTVPQNSGGALYDQRFFVFDVTATAGTYGGPDYVLRKAQAKVLGALPS